MDIWSKGLSPIRLPSGPSNSMARDNMSKNRGKATLKTVVRERERTWHFARWITRQEPVLVHHLIVRDEDEQGRGQMSRVGDRWLISSHWNKAMSIGKQVTKENQPWAQPMGWPRHRSWRWKENYKKARNPPKEPPGPSEVGATAEPMRSPEMVDSRVEFIRPVWTGGRPMLQSGRSGLEDWF